MTYDDARAAVDASNADALLAYTQDALRLVPASEWISYVAEGLWRMPAIGVRNAEAYLRRVARRLRNRAENSLFGSVQVRSAGRRVGTVHVQPYPANVCEHSTQTESATPLDPAGAVCLMAPTLRERRAYAATQSRVETHDADEATLQDALCQGVPVRDLAAHLAWSKNKSLRVYRRISRRKQAKMSTR